MIATALGCSGSGTAAGAASNVSGRVWALDELQAASGSAASASKGGRIAVRMGVIA